MKKRIMSILVVLSMVFAITPFFALPASAEIIPIIPANANAENVGTADNPYKLANLGNLTWFRDKINDGTIPNTSYADLTNDIDFENQDWTPIGTSSIKYSGKFDGRNYSLLNMNSSSYGLIGYATDAKIQNIHVYGKSKADGLGYQFSNCKLLNCSFDGDVGYSNRAGSLGNIGNCEAYYCWAKGTAYGNYGTGGLFRDITNSLVQYCYSTVSVRNTNDYGTGGYCANGGGFQIIDCYREGSVSQDTTGQTGDIIGTIAGNSAKVTRVHVANGLNRFVIDKRTSYTLTDYRYIGSGDTKQANYPNYDFENVWIMGDRYPILRQHALLEDEERRTVFVYDNDVRAINLPDYFNLVMAYDDKYQQKNCFDFEITKNETVNKEVLDPSDMSTETQSITLASADEADSDKLYLNGEVGIGTYNITVHAVDKCEERTTKFEEIDIPLQIVVKHRVPEPKVLVDGLSYSRSQSLVYIPITAGWYWDDSTICPKDTNTTGYKVYYPCESFINADNFETYYDTTALDDNFTYSYDAATNSIVTTLPVIVAESDESPRSMTITVLDADYPDSSPKPIEGATVVGEYDDEFVSENGHVTDAKGEVYAEISPGFEELNVSADGYQSKTETVEILGKPNTNAPVLKLTPVRTAYTACDVRERETDNPIPNAQVSIMKISDEPTLAWNGGADSLTVDAKTEFTLPDGFPDGRFKITNATYGWSHDDVAYMKVENGEYRYYTDAACTVLASDQTLASVLHATKLSEPMYDLRIDKATDGDAKHYVATVKLSNIAATYGTFGISWDPELFTFDPKTGFNAGAAVAGGVKTAEKLYNGADADDYNALGYYGFLWSASDKKDTVLNAELTPVEIATFDFYLKDASLADMLTVDTFSIEPWQDIKAARDWAAAGKAANANFDPKFWEYWRVCDSDNVRSNLKEGRIDATKSVVNGVETNGFFQAAVNGAIGDDNPSSFYDVMTDLQYGFPIKNSVIRFHVTDLYSGDEVEGAKIKLFDDTATKLLASKNTSYTGRANFTVNTADKTDPKFAYEVTKPGYWPLPLSQLDTDRPFVKTTTGKATEVEVQLDKKVYHDTVIVQNTDEGVDPAQTLELVKSADLGGERYAYNSRDFHFRIKGAKGYRIIKYPTRAWVSIGDDNAGDTKFENIEIKPSSSGLFTLDAKYLIQDSLTKEYMENVLGYTDVEEQPDKEGYRSYNIEVKFDQFEVMELDYVVEGMTGAHGTVAYDKDTADYTGNLEPFTPDPYTDGDYTTDIKVRTKKSSKDTSTDPATKIPADHKTGTFTFKADDGYMVERVYINGLQTDIYDDLTTFDYTFGDVDMDCSIIVMFWDGETPSTDSVLTLVVGDWGYVDALSPKEEQDLICTRRTYLNPTDNLEFTTNAAKFSTDYELYKVEREIEGESRVDITDKAVEGKYSVAPVEAKNVIAYVTFKNKDADITPTLFVKSYVYSGQGVADPAGILIYNFFDSVEIDLIADSANAWLARGVMLSPYEDLENVSEYEFEEKLPKNTYRYDSLTESIAIGSVFMEKAYPIDGYIDLGQKANISGAPIRGAVVKFVRLDDTTKQEKKKQIPFMTDSTAVRSNSMFETELPVGWWNVYVMKQGYVTYKITNFRMDQPVQDTDVRHFGHNGTVQQKVVPLIGSTRSGESITLEDAADVKSGMRKGVSSTVFNMTDVDNTGQIDYIDLAYVWKNYNKYMFEQEYSDFAANGSKDIAAMTTPEAP